MMDIISALRPRQWIKNCLILAPLFFANKALESYFVLEAVLAVISFIAASSAIYIINDLIDINKDKLHPQKKNRAIASGKVTWKNVIITALILITISLLLANYISRNFLFIVCVYLIMQVCYSTYLKNIILLDVIFISFGFVMRIIAGAVAINVGISFWIILCTFLGALFLAFSKRKNELMLLSEDAHTHRLVLGTYSDDLLKHLISIVAGSTILAYALYTQDRDTILKFGTDNLKYTIPFVVYGIFRYLFLVFNKTEGGDPAEVFTSDTPLILNITLFIIVVFIVLYL